MTTLKVELLFIFAVRCLMLTGARIWLATAILETRQLRY